jgi:hypothetical protein
LIDEVQHLYNPACKIQKVPHLILELVRILLFRGLETSLPLSLRSLETTNIEIFLAGKDFYQKRLSSIEDLLFSKKTYFMKVKNLSILSLGFSLAQGNICILNPQK